MRHSIRSLLMILLSALAGCTTGISTGPDVATKGEQKSVDPDAINTPATGIPYRLPMAQYEITATWILSACEPAPKQKDASANLDPEAGMAKASFTISTKYTTEIIDGPSYLIDYEKITNAFKTGSLKVVYHDKSLRLKSINGDIEGHEAEATAEAVKLGLTIAKLALPVPLPPLSSGSKGVVEKRQTPCLPAIDPKPAELKKMIDRLDELKDAANANKARSAALQAEIAGSTPTRQQVQTGKKLKDLGKAITEEADALNASVSKLTAVLSYSESFRFPGDFAPQTATLSPDPEKLQEWLEKLLIKNVVPKYKAKFQLDASLVPLVPNGNCPKAPCTPASPTLASPVNGVVFQQPVQARLRVVDPNKGTRLIDETVQVPQLGRLRVLPLASGWGEHNVLSANFSVEGIPTDVEYKSLSTPGLAALKTANEAASGVGDLLAELAQKKQAEKEAADKAAVASIAQQTAVLEAQAKLAKAQNALSPEVVQLQAAVAVLEMKKQQAELDAAIKAASAP